MTIIFVITALVFGVSVYDYYTSRSWQQVTSNLRNDVVFEERNRAYGAYQIRQNYNRNLILIMLCVVGSIGITYGINRYVNGMDETEIDQSLVDDWKISMEIPPVDEEVLPPPPPEPELPKLEKIVAFPIPEVVDEIVDTKFKSQDEMGDTQVGNKDQEGENDTFKDPSDKGILTGAGKEPEKDEIITFVDIQAEFPGGYQEMARFIAKNTRYPQEDIEMGNEGKVYLRFVVGKDGDIEDVRVTRGVEFSEKMNKEAIRVVKSMPNWKPGEVNGKAVRSYFDLPVNFKLD